jgi:plastocyanin
MRARHLAVVVVSLAFGGALHACQSVLPVALIDRDDAEPPSDVEAGGGSDTSVPDTSTPVDASEESALGSDSGAPDAPDADAGTADEPDGFVPPDPIPCTQAEFDAVASGIGGDFTAAGGVEVVFPIDALPVQYTHHCIKVKVGDVVTFEGKFSFHPLTSFGGDKPSPIPQQTMIDPPVGVSGMPELAVTMTTAGNFGFRCAFHPLQMFGAAHVVP